MKQERHISVWISEINNLLKEIQNSIFDRLDREGTHRKIDEDSARSIVRSVIGNHIKSNESFDEDE